MTPKERAKELVHELTQTIFESGNTVSKPMIIQCALIVANTSLEALNNVVGPAGGVKTFWNEVKQEINSL